MWSKIQYTELATEAYVLMDENEISGCYYHNNRHIDAMYQYLEDTNEPYDEVLDWAVMFHDVAYDAHKHKELRSAKLFTEMADKYSGCNLKIEDRWMVFDLIIATTNHVCDTGPNKQIMNAIIRADLHALTDKCKTVENFTKIMNESMTLYGCTVEEFAESNILFMRELAERMLVNMTVTNDEEHQFFGRVYDGIGLTIRLAEALKK